MKVWVIMEEYINDDDGDSGTDLEAVHLTEAGAQANLEPDYDTSGYMRGTRRREAVEMETLP